MHDRAYDYVREQVAYHDIAATTAVELGARSFNGSARDLFGPAVTWVGVDLEPGDNVDVVCDAGSFRSERPVDLVLCTEVLEHAERPGDLVQAAYECLRPGGVFVVTCAGPARAPHSAADGGPLRPGEHYRNLGYAELAMLLDLVGFDRHYVRWIRPPLDVYAVAFK